MRKFSNGFVWRTRGRGNGANAITGDLGDDHLYGGAGDDTLDGGKGADYLEGNAGDDTLSGGEGRDILLGGAGADTLAGGKDNDRLEGGAGDDTYKFTSGDGWDTITDSDGIGKIDIGGILLSGGKEETVVLARGSDGSCQGVNLMLGQNGICMANDGCWRITA